MRHFHYFDITTGVIHPHAIAINASVGVEEAAAANCPAGHKVIEGHYDHLSQRVDIATEGHPVIDWRPEQPTAEHEWDTDSRRWQLTQAAAERQQCRTEALERIAVLEAAQHRAVREILLKVAPDEAKRLAEIEAQIEGLRNGAIIPPST